MKTNTMLRSALSVSLAAALLAATAACGSAEALPVKALQPKQVEENPYMAKSDANIHHDGYNTDSTDEILPLAIYPEINVSYETTNANASPAILPEAARRRRLSDSKLLHLSGRGKPHRLPHQQQPRADAARDG